MNYLTVAFAAFGGGILMAFLGWLDSKDADGKPEPFNARKYGKSVGFAFLSALGFAVAYAYTDGVGIKDVLLAILGGAGVDGVSNRIMGAISK